MSRQNSRDTINCHFYIAYLPMAEHDEDRADERSKDPQTHRTVDRVTQIIEEVVYHPGMTFAELVRALGAAKSSVHGFMRGLLAKGWLYEENHRFYLGPAMYGLTLASGHIRAGMVTHADLVALHQETKLAVALGVRAGDHLVYVDEAGSDYLAGFEARTNIRRTLLVTAGGKALLAALPVPERDSYLRRQAAEHAELVDNFLAEFDQIRKTHIATNLGQRSTRFGIATTVCNRAGLPVASVTLVGATADVESRQEALGNILLAHVTTWSERSMNSREVI